MRPCEAEHERRYRETDSAWIREEFERYQNNRPCGTCEGYRLRPEALAVQIGAGAQRLHVGQVVEMSISDALDWVDSVPAALTAQRNEIARMLGGVRITERTRAHADEMLAATRRRRRRA